MKQLMQQVEVNAFTKINELLPGAKVIKLLGYANKNKDYTEGKKPIKSWQKCKTLTEGDALKWVEQGGWLGAVIPVGRFLVDIDDKGDGLLLKDLLEGENIGHHAIETPNGFQFIFKSETEETAKQGQCQNFVNRLGIVQDTRAPGKGYIVFPTVSTPGRIIHTTSVDRLDELPKFLYKVWNGQKTPSPVKYPYEGNGSRNGDFYDLARRLLVCHVPAEDVLKGLLLAYKYFVPYKDGFTVDEIKASVDSAAKKVGSGDGEQSAFNFQIDNGSGSPVNKTQTNYVDSPRQTIIPGPFLASKDGTLWKEKVNQNGEVSTVFVSRHIPYLCRQFHNIERSQVLYELAWKHRHGTSRETIAASVISSKPNLLSLSDKGFSVNDTNAKDLIKFMDSFLNMNDIPRFDAVERLGNIKGAFYHPLLTGNVEIVALDYGEKQIVEAFRGTGTAESWKNEVFERIKDHPKAVFIIAASFASVVLKDLGVQPFIVDLSGRTSQGKTTVLKVAASVWGNSDLVSEWNATKVSIERKAAFLNSFPLILDDTRKANEKVLKDVIYQFSGGRSKGRGSLRGSQREYTWCNILLSTGEVSLNDYAHSQGGAAARIIPLIDEPIASNQDNLTELYKAIEGNYGEIGIEFLKLWTKEKATLIPEYANFKNRYVTESRGNEVLSRLASYFAAIHFVGAILKAKMGINLELNTFYKIFKEVHQENKAIDKPAQFFEDILTELDSNKQDIFYDGEYEPRLGTKAVFKNGQLCILPAFLKEFLGVEEKPTRREWLKGGFTHSREEKGREVDYFSIKVRGRTYRVVPFNKGKVEEFGFFFLKDDFEGIEDLM